MRRAVVFAVAAVAVLTIGLIAADYMLLKQAKAEEPFYVGVTYCGSSPQEAKVLVDRVKSYTNLFVLQSGPLMTNASAVDEIGDYAVANGLHFAAYFDVTVGPEQAAWISTGEQRWGSMFAGVYLGDEPGGKMLDANVNFFGGNESIIKGADGGVTLSKMGVNISFQPNGVFRVMKYDPFAPNPGQMEMNTTVYYPNGTITFDKDGGDVFTNENGTGYISQLESYEDVQSMYPLPNCDVVAEKFVNSTQRTLANMDRQWPTNRSFPIFTSDYALYWWDYQSGYDTILAQLGWNNTVAQEIGLVRGAANLQNKSWGTIITWTYDKPPYLTSGNEMYDQMRMSYESGATYVIVFNYAKDMQGPYGIMQDEHFDALKRFWNDVVQNPWVAHGGSRAEAAFVLPKNYGWGLRRVDDSVWGLWEPNATAQQAWPLLQNAVTKYGLRLDIVFDDGAYPVTGKYQQIYYWNQTT